MLVSEGGLPPGGSGKARFGSGICSIVIVNVSELEYAITTLRGNWQEQEKVTSLKDVYF